MRLFTIFLSIALLGNAQTLVSGLYTYTVNPDNVSVTITGYPTTEEGPLVIPDSMDGRSVTSIGDYAFYNCSLTSIIIPDSVTSIGNNAFNGCTGLTSAIIGNSVTSIGLGAFDECSDLTSIIIPDSVTSIGDYAFFRCYGLTSIIIPDSVKIIRPQTFRDCSRLTSIIIPDGVTSIGTHAFNNCTALAFIDLQSIVAPTIAESAFLDISSAASIQYPQGAIGYAASYDGVPASAAPVISYWLPEGWVYFSWPYMYSIAEERWHFFDTDKQSRVNLTDGEWEKLSAASGWNYFAGLYSYSIAASTWHWYYLNSEQWVVDLTSGIWSIFGQ